MTMTRLVLALLQVYSLLIVARAIISWVSPTSRNDLVLWVIRLTEPLLRPIRTLVPLPGIDLSPLLAWLLIRFLMNLVVRI